MGFSQKFREFIQPSDEDEVVEYDDGDIESLTDYEEPKSKKMSKLSGDTKMVLYEPRSFDEVNEIAKRLKENRAIVVNLHKLTREYAQRTIDFLQGVIFAVDGTIEKIGTNVILCTPRTMGVSGKINSDVSDDE
ncbi:MAG: cell division protein SepF [Breznakia sp.]